MRWVKFNVPIFCLLPAIGFVSIPIGVVGLCCYLDSRINQTETEDVRVKDKTPLRLFWEENDGTFKILATYIRDVHCVVIEGVKTKQRKRMRLDYDEIPVLVGETWLTKYNNNNSMSFSKLVD